MREKKASYFQKLTATAPGDCAASIPMRWYYRKIRWVNATEETSGRLLWEPVGMLPQACGEWQCFRWQVSGVRCQVSGLRFQVTGLRTTKFQSLRPETCHLRPD